jgi:host factor-I protein
MVENITLNMIVQEKLYITLFLVNGVPVKGHMVSFDDKTVIMETMGSRKMIYKHAISTIEF